MHELLLISAGAVLGISFTMTVCCIVRPSDAFWDGYAGAFAVWKVKRK